jgi:hypothetical protein
VTGTAFCTLSKAQRTCEAGENSKYTTEGDRDRERDNIYKNWNLKLDVRVFFESSLFFIELNNIFYFCGYGVSLFFFRNELNNSTGYDH